MTIESFAPGRLLLFGDQQEPLGLSVLALALDRGITVRLEPVPGSATFDVELPDIGRRDAIAIDGATAPAANGRDDPCDGLRAGVQELVAAGARFPSGARLVARGDLPLAAGCGASTARIVAFLRALAEFAGTSATRLAEPRRLAELAWQAEVGHFGGSGGRADALVVAIGGLCHLNFGPTPFVQELPQRLDGLLLIESGEPKEARGGEARARHRQAVERAIAALRAVEPALDLATISYESIWNLMVDAGQDDERDRLVFATLLERDRLLAALRFLAETPLDRARIGELLDDHDARLREALGGATPRLEELRRAAQAAGALGVKRNGAGGSLVALAPGREEAVIAAMRQLGARARCVATGAGARISAADRA